MFIPQCGLFPELTAIQNGILGCWLEDGGTHVNNTIYLFNHTCVWLDLLVPQECGCYSLWSDCGAGKPDFTEECWVSLGAGPCFGWTEDDLEVR